MEGQPPEAKAAVKGLASPVGEGVLRQRITATGQSLEQFTVLSAVTDPYRLDNRQGHELGQWLADKVAAHVRPGQRVHLRGLHYRLVATTGVLKLDGTPYANTWDDWKWLCEKAAKCARWLGYVPFDRIVDERNEKPRIYDQTPDDGWRFRPIQAQPRPGLDVDVPGDDDLLPDIGFDGGSAVRQPYRIVMVGEKTSLAEVLDPIGRNQAAELLLPTGDITDTMIFEMMQRAALDDRPLVVLYFSDFDPSGYHMPTCISRKVQAFRDLLFPDLTVAGVHAVALTVEQCLEHGLPESFLKETEKRSGAWKARWNREQTEIDALASLRPEVLLPCRPHELWSSTRSSACRQSSRERRIRCEKQPA